MSSRPRCKATAMYSLCMWLAAVTVGSAASYGAPMIAPEYASEYTLTVLGTVPGIDTAHGGFAGLTIMHGDYNSLLLGANGGHRTAAIHRVELIRDPQGNVTGFGNSSQFSEAYGLTGGIDGSLLYGPNGVLFYTSYPDNHIGQIKPGSTEPDKLTNLIPMMGVASSVGAMTFVPDGFPGAGRLKIATYSVSRWYDGFITPDGAGTYTITIPFSEGLYIGGSPEGMLYVPLGSKLFEQPTVLITEFANGVVAAYNVDANGDPIPSTRSVFLSGLPQVEGITMDPLTGDLLLSTFERGNLLVRVDGFAPDGRGVLLHSPEPSSAWLFGSGCTVCGLIAAVRRRYLREADRCEGRGK